MAQPPIDDMAEAAYDAFLSTLGAYRPPFAQPWQRVPEPVQEAWREAVRAGLAVAQRANA